MNKYIHIIQSARPINVAIAALSAVVGYWFVTGEGFGLNIVLAALSIGLNCAGGNLFNDYYDLEIDKINRPDRPYAAGLLTDRDMILSGSVSFLTAVLAGILISIKCGIFAFVIALLLIVYNTFAKKVVLLGNIIVSVLTATAFLFGGVAAGNAWGTIIPALFALLFHFGREILKDIEDIEGDSAAGVITFPVKYGKSAAEKLAVSTYVVLFIFTLYPFFFLNYSLYYLITVIIGVDFLTAYLLYSYLSERNPKNLLRLNLFLKAGMVFGLTALLLK